MECKHPVKMYIIRAGTRHSVDRRCNNCTACRITIKQEWTLRIILENYSHIESYFITLTYSEMHLPEHNSLNKKHLTAFFKKLRKLVPQKLRYYACGEYGKNGTRRPHYHAIIFGLKRTQENLVKQAWGKGGTEVGFFSPQRAAYVASYTTKKLRLKENCDINQQQEYSTMSRMPGIGKHYMENHLFPKLLQRMHKSSYSLKNTDYLDENKIHKNIRIGKTLYPMPAYIKNSLKKKIMEVFNLKPETDLQRLIRQDHYARTKLHTIPTEIQIMLGEEQEILANRKLKNHKARLDRAI